MRDERSIRARRYFPHAVVATTAVALLPVGVVWELRARGVISSTWLCIGVAIVLSLAASAVGSAYWRRRPSAGDVLFSELMIWGWLARVRVDRQIARATRELGLDAASGGSPRAAAAGPRFDVLSQLAAAIEAHDPFLDGHSHRVARYSAAIAHKLGLPAQEVRRISQAAAVHDIGKLRIPREVLMKPAALTDEEYEIVKRHSAHGADIVAPLGDPVLTEMVRYHHERLDGSGYPAGLNGEAIPLGARIIAVADTFDAIASPRPYRPAARHKRALDILRDEAGVALDGSAVRAFISYYSGNRVLAIWAALGALPQRALAVVKPGVAATRTVALAPAAATVAMSAVVAAVVPAAAVPIRAHLAAARAPLSPRATPLSVLAAPAPRRTETRQTRQARRHHRGQVRKVHKALAVLVAQSPSSATAPRTAVLRQPSAPGAPSRPRASGSPAPSAKHSGRAPAPTSRPPSATTSTTLTASTPPPTTSTPAPPPPTTTPTPTPTTPPPPVGPTTKSQCMHDGWHQWWFATRGQCIDWVEHH